jgi:ribonucleotide reductase beta subunit family protein with ferritin-like domain
VSGLNSSVRDENIHALGGALLFNLETQYLGKEVNDYQDKAYEVATLIVEHEKEINKITFAEGELDTYTITQANHFVEHRADVCLINAGFKPLFKPKYNPVAEWFYDDINSLRLHDFFAQSGGEYSMNWVAESFDLDEGWN